MTRIRRTVLEAVLCCLLAIGITSAAESTGTAAEVGADTAAPARTSVTLKADRAVGFRGDYIRLSGVVSGGGVRPVKLKLVWPGGSVGRADTTTSPSGWYRFTVRLPVRPGEVVYRVVAPRTRIDGASRPGGASPTLPVMVDGKPWRVIDSGDTTCGIRIDRSGWCWGYNSSGQVGSGVIGPHDGLGLYQRTPSQLPGRWRIVTNQGATTCGIRPDDSGWYWGNGAQGQIGNGSGTGSATPVRVPGRWKSLQPGRTVCGIQLDDTGWCWGSNSYGEIGDGTTDDRLTPFQVPGRWASIGPGCGVKLDGSLWCSGDNTFGGLGNNTNVAELERIKVNVRDRPNADWQGYGGLCSLLVDDSLYCWGYNRDGRVGWGDPRDRWAPYRHQGRWQEVQSGSTTCGLRTDASLWCWGLNDRGQVGDGTREDAYVPHQLAGKWRSFSVLTNTVCAVRTDDTGWCWGWNIGGSVGDGTTEDRLTPYQLPGRWQSIGEDGATCGVRLGGAHWCWGVKYIGDGTDDEHLVPTRVPGRWRSIGYHYDTCGIKPDGSGWCWGYNVYGGSGAGVQGPVLTPKRLLAN